MEVASSSLVARSINQERIHAFLISIWYRSQVVRPRSAKPLFASSNLAGTSKKNAHLSVCVFFFCRNRHGQIWTINCRCPVDICLPPARWRQLLDFHCRREWKCNKSGRYMRLNNATSLFWSQLLLMLYVFYWYNISGCTWWSIVGNTAIFAASNTAQWCIFFALLICGASDVTRTRDLLITSANLAVFYRFVSHRKALQSNHFSNLYVSYRLTTKRIFF